MGTKVNIMDLEVDLLTPETLHAELLNYMDNDRLSVVHMISLDYMDAYEQNELMKNVLEQADLVLPGEKAILTRHHVDVLETGGMVVDYHSILTLLEPLRSQEKTIYLVMRDAKEAKKAYRYLAEYFGKERIVGVYAADGEITEEALVNDINTKLPDIILLSMESTNQEEWLENNRAKVNARLCFAMGSIMPQILRENVYVPAWMKKLHLGELYRRIVGIPYSHAFRRRIFHRKMDDYNTKKKFWR